MSRCSCNESVFMCDTQTILNLEEKIILSVGYTRSTEEQTCTQELTVRGKQLGVLRPVNQYGYFRANSERKYCVSCLISHCRSMQGDTVSAVLFPTAAVCSVVLCQLSYFPLPQYAMWYCVSCPISHYRSMQCGTVSAVLFPTAAVCKVILCQLSYFPLLQYAR